YEGYELCDNCYQHKQYVDLDHFKTHDTIFNSSGWTASGLKTPSDRDWYRPEGFSSQTASKPKARRHGHETSPTRRSTVRQKTSNNQTYRDAAGLIHKPELEASNVPQGSDSLYQRRRPERKVPLLIDAPKAQTHDQDSAALNMALEPDKSLQTRFELASSIRKRRQVHFDSSQRHRPEHLYRNSLTYDRVDRRYMPGVHADRSGNGYLNTSGFGLDWEDWRALAKGIEPPRPTVSQKRLPGPYVKRPAAPRTVLEDMAEEVEVRECETQSEGNECSCGLDTCAKRFKNLRQSSID
ncbi:MAG: hypothetical protein M1828_001015, partial [Chrysothrix sp. TS-e1954]